MFDVFILRLEIKKNGSNVITNRECMVLQGCSGVFIFFFTKEFHTTTLFGERIFKSNSPSSCT